MKRIAILMLVSLFYINAVMAQIVNQDANGKSTLIMGGGSTSFDFSQAVFKINYYSNVDQEKGVLWGGELQGKSASGIANLFAKEKFVPEGNASFLIGGYYSYRSSNAQADYKALMHASDSLNRLFKQKGQQFESATLPGFLNESFKSVCDKDTAKKEDILNLTSSWAERIKVINNYISSIDDNPKDNCRSKLKEALDRFMLTFVNSQELSELISLEELIQKVTDRKNNFSSKIHYTGKLKYYLRAGVNTTGFKLDKGDSIRNVDNRFSDTLHIGPYAEIGISWRIRGKAFIGVAGGIQRISNFSSLDKATYSHTQIDTLNNTLLQQKDEITAYKGEFKQKWGGYINADYLHLISINKDSSQYIGINPFIRLSFPGQSLSLDKFKASVGIGAYFINSKTASFQGGIYLQSTDVSGKTESNFGKTITFGIVAKFMFASLSL